MYLKKIISIACSVALSAVLFSVNVVSAYAPLPSLYPTNMDDTIKGYFSEVVKNSGMSNHTGECTIMLTEYRYGTIRGIVLTPLDSYDLPAVQWVRDHGTAWVGNWSYFETNSLENLSTCTFTYHEYDPSVMSWGIVHWDNINSNYEVIQGHVENSQYIQEGVDHNFIYLKTVDNSFIASNDHYITGIDLSINEEGFYQWLVDNDKVAVDVSSGGVSVGGKIPAYIGMAKLKSFIHFYSQYGGSNSSFSKFIWQWFSYMNIFNQTVDNVNILKQTTDMLYQEYLNSYMITAYNNSANQVHHRRNIETNTTDDDVTLITDDSNDTVDISILRDILRAVIQFQTTFADYMERLFAKIDDLEFVTTVVNDGGSTVPNVDLSDLYIYDVDAFNDDLADFEADIEDVQSVPMGYISAINQNGLMPENMLEDKNSLTVNVPTITGFTVGNSGSTYSTQTGTYVLRSVDYPWLDTAVQKIKRFASIILILGYLVHLRYRIPELIRGE